MALAPYVEQLLALRQSLGATPPAPTMAPTTTATFSLPKPQMAGSPMSQLSAMRAAPQPRLADLASRGATAGLVPIGGGHKLAADAAAAYRKALEFLGGTPISLTDSHRTTAQQADLYRRKPGLAAKPGHSLHESGYAIDVANWRAVGEALRRAGWRQFNAKKEPWHFSWGRTG